MTSQTRQTSESQSPSLGIELLKGLMSKKRVKKPDVPVAQPVASGPGMASDSVVPSTPPVPHANVPTHPYYPESKTPSQSQSPTKDMLTMLLVGEIDAGKTALLNVMANILEGQDPMTYRAMHDASNETTGSTVGSRTHEAHMYEFRGRNGVRIRLIDTPGLADTRGSEHDENHLASIVRVIREAIVIDGVLIVANGTTDRLQPATDYTIMTLASIFPRSIADNIAIVFTNVSDPTSFNFQVDSLPGFLQRSCIFSFDNPVALMKKNQALRNNPFFQGQALPQSMIDNAHANAVGMLAKLSDWLNQCTFQDTSAIEQLHKKGRAVDRRIDDALSLINTISEKQRDAARINADIERARLLMRTYEKFETTVTRSTKVRIDSPHYNTLCSRPNCCCNCHLMCDDVSYPFGSENFKSCAVMRDGTCTKCHHPSSDHHYANCIWEERTESEIVINEATKVKYYAVWQDKTNSENALDEVEAVVRDLNAQIEILKPEIGALCISYQALSMSGSLSGQISKSVALFKRNLETLQFGGADSTRIQAVDNIIQKMRQKRRLVEDAIAAAKNAHHNPPDSAVIPPTSPSQDLPKPRPQDGFEALMKGFLLTKKHKLTILVVGETGVGKTALLNLITNVLQGQDPTTYRDMHKAANEAGGSTTGSQTKQALIYEFKSLNGIIIRLLDTPGLADTRGLEHDQKHKASIARAIQDTIPMVDGILIVANGTTERLQVATDYAVTTLASIFPRSIADNIAIVFTMVSNPLRFNFQMESLPRSLHHAKVYLVDNPMSLMKRYHALQRNPSFQGQLPAMSLIVDAHADAVKMLFNFFGWLDQCTVQPTSAIVELYNSVCDIDRRIQNALARISSLSDKRRDVVKIGLDMSRMKQVMKQYATFETIMNKPIKVQTETPQHNTLCSQPACYSNCHMECGLSFSLDPERFQHCFAMTKKDKDITCKECGHPSTDHRHYNSKWEDKTDTQVVVDEDAKNKFYSAEQDSKKHEAALDQVKSAIKDLDSEIEGLKAEIGTLCNSYQLLALSGSFAGQISKAIRLFELHLESLRTQGADSATIKLVEDSIFQLQQKKALVDDAAAVANAAHVHLIPAAPNPSSSTSGAPDPPSSASSAPDTRPSPSLPPANGRTIWGKKFRFG